MHTIFKNNYITKIFCDDFEKPCLHKAIEDLSSDLVKVSNKEPAIKKHLPYTISCRYYMGL